ncbi:hypothetical protein [Edwardsiella phage IW-1]|uniref:Uncharacterized protein n=1 Tax=Edwardsiella phage IW-1 TaxID=1244857 RepID=K4PYB7_9CAUD|nr:hypothetical protein [Edwardsiella phage IW-1]
MFNMKNVVAAVMPNLVAVEVTFGDGRAQCYTYLAPASMGVCKGDKVVVCTPASGLKVVSVVRVSEDFDLDVNFEYRYVAARLDFSEYEKLMHGKAQVEAAYVASQRAAARKQLADVLTASLSDDVKALLANLGAKDTK